MARLALAIFPLALAIAQTGPRLVTFHSDVDDSDQPYALYVPESFNPAHKYPLVIALHSEDSNHRLTLRRTLGVTPRLGEPDTADMRYFPPVRDVDTLVACPLARGAMGYQGIAEKDVYDVLADVQRRFPVDPDRVYLTGVSMGGAGALWLALTRPGVWAAVAAVAPSQFNAAELAPNLLNLPVRIYHGDLDPVVPVENSREWQRRFVHLGVPTDYIEYPGIRHNAGDLAYKDGALFDWYFHHPRNPSPDRVRFVTRSYEYSSAYWLRIDGLTPGTLASFDGSWTAKNALKADTQNIDGFTVTSRAPTLPLTITIDGTIVRTRPGDYQSFLKTATGWRAGRSPSTGKRAGLEGPISEAVSSRQIYVYGTTGARTAEELEARREVAQSAARWTSPRSRIAVNFTVKADTAVSSEDRESANLVLFGTAETNAVIARLAPGLPVSLHPGAADYGLVFIAPAGRHYVLVNSGLPWWTGADEASRGGNPWAPEPYRLLTTFGDYILFKGSLANVVAEGRFDRNWKLPPDAAAKMNATGTVTLPSP